ncbi:MAG: RNA polymerase sigma factor [Sphingopyxis sp.]|nr:RNA polymerase sigma factor [Sphingopyxis sp.]
MDAFHASSSFSVRTGNPRVRAVSRGPENPPAVAVTVGDRARLDSLFREESPRLLSYFRRKTGDHDAANDLMQESFVQIVQVSRFADLANPAAYLQRIARNLLFSQFRGPRKAFERQLVALDDNSDIALPPQQEASIEADQLLLLYEQALDDMAPKTREIFLMSRRDGMTYKQIQTEVSLSMGTVEYHMMRAIAHIDRYLDDHGENAR